MPLPCPRGKRIDVRFCAIFECCRTYFTGYYDSTLSTLSMVPPSWARIDALRSSKLVPTKTESNNRILRHRHLDFEPHKLRWPEILSPRLSRRWDHHPHRRKYSTMDAVTPGASKKKQTLFHVLSEMETSLQVNTCMYPVDEVLVARRPYDHDNMDGSDIRGVWLLVIQRRMIRQHK